MMTGKLPALKPKRVIKALERGGFQIRRITGSHYILKKERHIVTVPYHNTDLKRGTLASIIKQAGLTIDEFLDLL
jgi:predicted RNA binding protein YcfA (HicA-like mRNA interferase family)